MWSFQKCVDKHGVLLQFSLLSEEMMELSTERQGDVLLDVVCLNCDEVQQSCCRGGDVKWDSQGQLFILAYAWLVFRVWFSL